MRGIGGTVFAFFALSLALLCLPLSAQADAEGERLRVATFECDATLPMGSEIYGREVTEIEHPLLAKGVVLEAGQQRYVLCALDWRGLGRDQNRFFRKAMAEASGTDPSAVAIQCIHQHTAPSGSEAGQEFREKVASRLDKAIQEAVRRLVVVDQIGTGQAEVKQVASTRRIPDEDGKVIVRYTSTKGKPHLRDKTEGYIDPYLKTITFASDGEPVARLHYYATHPQSFYLDGRVSWDFPAMAREQLQEQEGVFQVYFTGCAGDIGAGKYNDGSREARARLAERMFQGMESAAAATEYEPVKELKWRTTEVTFPSKKDPESKTVGPVEMSSWQIGRVHVLHLPGEPMVHYQLYAQQLVEEGFVAVAGYGDGSTGYICTAEAFQEGGYEPRASRVAPHSQELLERAIRRLMGLEN